MTDIGIGNKNYEEVQKLQSAVTGGMSANFVLLPDQSRENPTLGLKISSKSLEKNESKMQELMLETIKDANFSDAGRIKDMLNFISSDNERSLIQNGHMLAMSNAGAQINNIAATNDMAAGINFITNTKSLSKTIGNKDNIEKYTLKNIDKEPSFAPEVNLVEYDKEAERKIAAHCLYSSSQKSIQDLKNIVSELPENEIKNILNNYTGERKNRRHKPGRAFENSNYTFDILSDYGSFRDLQRHRLMTIEWQKMNPELGFNFPEEVKKTPFEDECNAVVDKSRDLYVKLSNEFGQLKEYSLLFGHNIRYSITMNVRQAFHLIELRTAKQGHISYRRVCMEMHNQIKEIANHNNFYELMSFTDHEEYELQRLDSEVKQSKKEKS